MQINGDVRCVVYMGANGGQCQEATDSACVAIDRRTHAQLLCVQQQKLHTQTRVTLVTMQANCMQN